MSLSGAKKGAKKPVDNTDNVSNKLSVNDISIDEYSADELQTLLYKINHRLALLQIKSENLLVDELENKIKEMNLDTNSLKFFKIPKKASHWYFDKNGQIKYWSQGQRGKMPQEIKNLKDSGKLDEYKI